MPIASLLGSAFIRIEARRLARLLRRATGYGLIATGAAYLVIRGPGGDPAADAATLVLLAIGSGMLTRARLDGTIGRWKPEQMGS